MSANTLDDAPQLDSAHPAGLRWPSKSHWLDFATYLILVQVLWCIVYGGTDWITAHHSWRVRLHLDVELGIPFYSAASVVYLSLLPLTWLSPFIFHSRQQLRDYAKKLACLICISGIGFLLLPSLPAFPTPRPTGLFAPDYRFMDRINLSYNMCPSLHVGMATMTSYTYAQVSGRAIASVVLAWAIAIALSTLFTHQHHVIDVLAGALLGYVVARHGGKP